MAYKFRVAVRDNRLGYPMKSHYIVKEESGDVARIVCALARHKVGHLGEVIDHHEYGVSPLL